VPDYSVVFHDTADVRTRGPAFSANSQRLYCGRGTSGPSVYVLDLQADEPQLEERPLPYPELQLRKIIPSVDETKWLLYRRIRHDVFAFEVYDVGMDSLVFSHVFGPGYGDMAMTPDGRYVFYTSPGTLNSDIPACTHAYVFDVESNVVHEPIQICTPRHEKGLPVGPVAITPDGRTLVVLGGLGTGEFAIVDVQAKKQVEHYYLGQEDINRVLLMNVYCQNSFTN
jgi:hypothetical protein